MADVIGNSIPNPIMVYGRAPNGQLQAVTTDGNGNLSVAGGGAISGGTIIDVTASKYGVTPAIVVSNGANFTITSGSAVVTCTTCKFLTGGTGTGAAAVGHLFAASNWTGSDTNYTLSAGVIPGGTTVLSIQSDTQLTLSANATGNAGTTNSNNGIFAYGADGLAGLNSAITDAWMGNTCKFILLPGVPFILSAAPNAATPTCPGIQGGSTSSHYGAIGGIAPFISTILLAPGFTCSAAQCFGGQQGIGYANLTFNGLGQSINLTGKNFFATANDGQYDNLSFFGISASNSTARTMTCVQLNGGYHKFSTVTVDGCGDMGTAQVGATTPYTTAGLLVPAGQIPDFGNNLFIGNTGGTLASIGIGSTFGFRDSAYIMSNQTGSGVGLDCAGNCMDFGGVYLVPSTASSTVWYLRNGSRLDVNQVSYQNNGNSISNIVQWAGTTGLAKIANARLLQPGASGFVFGGIIPVGATIIDGGNNVIVTGTEFSTPPTMSCATGFCGVGNSVAVAGLSTVERGNFTITAAGTPTASGVLTLTFNQTYGINSTPICTLHLANTGTASWNARASTIVQSIATTSYTWTVDNNAAALVAASTYTGVWQCTQR